MASNGKELPSRATTMSSVGSEDAVPEIDPTSTAGLLAERLQAWKHAVSYLEEYMSAIEKIHKAQAKEYERALKVISHPLREGQHFDQSLGGVAGFFENMRANTQALINTNVETEKSIKGSVIPVLERLHKEIKHKGKELAHGAEKSAKEVEKARNTTQKHIELLGQQTAQFESTGARMSGHEDPYVVRRGVMHRLNKQVMEENNYRNDLISVQNNFATFEAHVIQVIQQSMESFTQLTGGQGEKTRALHSDMLGAAQRIPPDFEWKAFVQRSGERLVNPHEAPRAVESITFPNMDHRATQSLIEGSLERKSRNKLSFGYSTGYYVVTPSKFLHEFKDSDDARHDPKPELSIYLPEAVIGTPSGEKFSVKGKDKSKTISSKLTGSAELSFKAHTAADAQKWFDVLKTITGTVPASAMSEPSSPVVDSPVAAEKAEEKPAAVEPPAAAAAVPATTAAAGHTAQESGVTGEPKTAAVDHATSPVDKETAPAATTSTTTAPAATAPAATVPATQPAAPAAAEVKPAEVKPAAATTATTT